jgi:hypothetical protein
LVPPWSLVLCAVLLASAVLTASDQQGQVRFGEVPVHGAVVQATQGDTTHRTLTDPQGRYSLPELSDGTWTIQIEMPGFETARRDLVVTKEAAAVEWNLRMLPLADIRGETSTGFPKADPAAALALSAGTPSATDGFLINGSVVNGAATNLGLQRAFGNNRTTRPSPYRGQASLSGSSSLFDARPFSITGLDVRQPSYGRALASVTIGGPLQIPGLFRRGNFTALYSRNQSTTASIDTGRVPTDAERLGDFSSSAFQPVDPATGLPFPGGLMPANRISPQAQALLALYPHANIDSGPFNYQVPTVGTSRGDGVQIALNNFRFGLDLLTGTFAYQRRQSDNTDMFGFTDSSRSSGINASASWQHRFTPRVSSTLRYEFSRNSSETVPFHSTYADVSGEAGGGGWDPRGPALG